MDYRAGTIDSSVAPCHAVFPNYPPRVLLDPAWAGSNHTMIRKDGCDFCTACGAVGTCG